MLARDGYSLYHFLRVEWSLSSWLLLSGWYGEVHTWQIAKLSYSCDRTRDRKLDPWSDNMAEGGPVKENNFSKFIAISLDIYIYTTLDKQKQNYYCKVNCSKKEPVSTFRIY